MAATGTPTQNLGLRIPQGTDPASVDDINYNSNLLDTKIGAVGNDSVQDQIDSLNSNKAKIVYEDLTITNGNGIGVSAATNYRCSYEKFLSAIVIGSNNIVAISYTYSNLVYVTLKNAADMSNAPAGNYTVRVFYTNEAQAYT